MKMESYRVSTVGRLQWAATRGAGLCATKIAILVVAVSPLAAQTTGGAWSADAKNGCRIWDPHPQPQQSITWSGQCVNGFAEGRGRLQWFKDGVLFETDEGAWYQGRQMGNGSQIWPLGNYQGGLRDGEPAGHGVLTLGDARYEGEFSNGRPDGVGTLQNSSGTFQGMWKNGCFRDDKRKASMGVPLPLCP